MPSISNNKSDSPCILILGKDFFILGKCLIFIFGKFESLFEKKLAVDIFTPYDTPFLSYNIHVGLFYLNFNDLNNNFYVYLLLLTIKFFRQLIDKISLETQKDC